MGYAEAFGSADHVHVNRADVLTEHLRRGIFGNLLKTVIAQAQGREITADVAENAHHLKAMQRVGFEVEKVEDTRAFLRRSRV